MRDFIHNLSLCLAILPYSCINKKRFLLFRFLFFLFLTIPLLTAQETITINQGGDSFFDFKINIYEDKSTSLTIQDMQKINTFTSHSNRISNGYSSSAYWVTFKLKNKTTQDLKYYLKFTENFTDKVDYYLVSQDGSYESYKEGPGYFSSNKENLLIKPIFPITLQANETKTIYFRMYSIFPSMTSFYILDSDALHTYILKHDTLYALYFGAIIALILYNLFILVFSRNIAYLYYVLYATPFLFWQMRLNGVFPFDTFSSTSTYYLHGLLTPFFISFIIFFSREVLDTKKLFPKSDRVIIFLGYLYIFFTFTSIFDIHNSTYIATKLLPIVLPFLLIMGFRSYFSGNKTALFYIIAQLIFLTTSIMFSMTVNGHLEYTLLSRHGLVVGSFIEMILFSLALAYKIRELQKEKIAIVAKANAELDSKIKERTQELEDSKDQLKELANRDPMTNLYNRRSFFDMSLELLNIAKREDKPLSLVMFDIDKFKNINDTYGHAIGDKVITLFASIIEQTRESDIAVRIGGEEFVLLLPNTDKNGAYKIATNIRKAVEKQKISVDNKEYFHYTISGGVSSINLKEETDIHKTLSRADENLYKAKKNGRNLII